MSGPAINRSSTPRVLRRLAVAIVALVMVAAGAALAAPGDLDPSWNGNGKLLYAAGNDPTVQFDAAAFDAHGLVLVAGVGHGNMEVMRFEKDGTLDRTFASDGVFRTGGGLPSAIATDSEGRILIASSQNGSAVRAWRLTPSGQLDTSFHSQGYKGFKWEAGRAGEPFARLVIDGRDRPVLAGTALGDPHEADYGYALARLTTGGSL